VAGCGGARQTNGTRTVQLALSAPASGTRVAAGTIAVAGKVSTPRATVLVAGHRVELAPGGHFTTSVDLAVGTNLIDVIAGAPQARPAMLAIRVVRYELVSVPSVIGLAPGVARKALGAAGLKVKVSDTDNIFTEVLPETAAVCNQSPAPGSKVSPGATIKLQASKFCL
jgi:hypothetical protein